MTSKSLKYQDEVWVRDGSQTAVSTKRSSLIRIIVLLLLTFVVLAGVLVFLLRAPEAAAEPAAASPPKINVPYFADNIAISERAVFWFGEVNETSNYADVRVGYNDEMMIVQVAAFDRLLWFDTTPSLAEIPEWDAATLYVNTSGNSGSAPTGSSYQFLGMHSPKGGEHFGAYKGNGSGWVASSTSFNINTGTQASGFNNLDEDRGWWVAFEIPFASLGMSGPPADGAIWGVGVALHDRDDAAGTAIPMQVWPDGMNGERPSTWGQFSFGTPVYNPPAGAVGGTTVIRDGGDGNTVVDVHAGGHSVCGGSLWPDRFFSDWGYLNYDGYPQINIQNQFNLGDWPCFSKYFVTFPLDDIPAGKVILSAELSMYEFGNAGQGGTPTPQPTLLQVAAVDSAWNEATLNWNNAPQIQENYATSWAGTIPPGGDGFFVTWDVSRAVADAVEAGGPLRLSVYTADANRNSGKYFVSSEGALSKPERRPTLTVVWGDPPLTVTPSVWVINAGE
ncbi:MAG: DNRLRE domain-containing protein, partial [Anaerolineales bacterium]|nr:DNRLRE domain-containing protein [Anaerolineales bacterium]